MSSVTGVIVSSIIPVFLIIFVGFVLNRAQDVDVGPLNTLSLFVLTPALIIHSITLTELGADVLLKVSLGVGIFLTIILASSWIFGRIRGKEGAIMGSFLLIAAFGNTGTLGIPLADFAFDQTGRQTAVLFAAVHGTAVYTIGLMIASSSGKKSGLQSLKRVFQYPLIYAVAIAAMARMGGFVPPADSPIMETLGLVGDSAIPVMLIILGIQLSETEMRSAMSMTVSPTVFRFLVSPIIGIGVVVVLGFQNTTVAQVFVLLTAMPVAVSPVIFVVEFARETSIKGVTLPEFVSTNIFVTTVVSIPVLAIVVILLKSGMIV